MILSGSVSLEPLLEEAGLSAKANIFSALRPETVERGNGRCLPGGACRVL